MNVLWVDTETGGTDPVRHGLISLAYIVDINGVNKESGVLYSNCEGKFCGPEALATNGFIVEQIRNFLPPRDMWSSLKKVMARYVNPYDKIREGKFYFGGYNAQFDWGFLSQLWEDNNDKYLMSFFNYGKLDVSVLARFIQYSGQSFPARLRLDDLAQYLGVARQGESHDAMSDIEVTRDCAQKLLKMWIRKRARLEIPPESPPIVF